ncbi:uncharacterized protein [Clytia hemisphaerica]|uniref:uncharacterized protein n=1 Tax=Clytia hemisphaerica TaxID=252671 RepID=UPI0034D3A18B
MSEILPQEEPMPVEVIQAEPFEPMDVETVPEGPMFDVLREESQGNDIRNDREVSPPAPLFNGDLEDFKQMCYDEIKQIDKSSTIKDTSIDKIVNFNYNEMCDEIDELCPVLSTALKGKPRYPNRRNVVNCRNDQLFVAAGVKKRAFGWFNKLGVTNCYRTAVDVNGGMAKRFR